ncbi:MAG: 4'-phosphopantetheinyl transferase superfamily protein [Chloroflexi bacterium]|nr:4'-phosphopantetheinyl transferase superfamily protein [Chloroflexota bacterium]
MAMIVRASPEGLSPVAGPWWSPFTTTAGVQVVHVALSPAPACEAEAYGWLDQAERDAWHKYLPRPRRQFTLCRAALRAILCEQSGCRNDQLSFGAGSHGKPFAMAEGACLPLNFNVSHSGRHGLIALSVAGRLGVDIEERIPRRHLEELIAAVMGPEEQAELAVLREPAKLHRFYRLWTLKEALIKALGTGFSTDPSGFQAPPAMRRGGMTGVFSFPHLPSVAWRLEDIGDERFAAALAYELEGP